MSTAPARRVYERVSYRLDEVSDVLAPFLFRNALEHRPRFVYRYGLVIFIHDKHKHLVVDFLIRELHEVEPVVDAEVLIELLGGNE